MCLSPVLLDNPMASRLWYYRTSLYIDSKLDNSWTHSNKNTFFAFSSLKSLVGFYVKVHDTSIKETDPKKIDYLVNNTYIIVNGLRINCFISAPCGHCSLCKDSRRREYQARALFEASDYPWMYFYTLTYSDIHLPVCGLLREHVVSFHKRFRENLSIEYSKRYNCSLQDARSAMSYRTLYVGEYGTDVRYSRRPHYHGILFFKNCIPDKDLPWVHDIFKSSWIYGIITDFQSVRNPSASARYICKYITKQDLSVVPEGKNPTFIQGPSRNGGLGCSNIAKHLDSILNSKDNCITLRCGSFCTRTKIPKAVLDKVFPTFSRVYGSSVCNTFYEIDRVLSEAVDRSEKSFFFDKSFLSICHDILKSYDWLRVGLRKEVTQDFFDKYGPFGYVDELKSLDDYELYERLYCLIYSKLCSLPPTPQQFFQLFSSKLHWQNSLVLPDLPFEERMLQKESRALNNLKYVELHMLHE